MQEDTPTKLYVLSYHYADDVFVVGVFSSMDRAKLARREHSETLNDFENPFIENSMRTVYYEILKIDFDVRLFSGLAYEFSI